MKSFRTIEYNGPEGPLLSFTVSCEVFWKSDIVLQNVKQFLEIFRQFSEVFNSCRKSQTVMGRLKQFVEVLNSSRRSQKVSRSFKLFSKLWNSFWKSQTLFLPNFKQFLVVSMSFWGSKKILGIFKMLLLLSDRVCTATTSCVRRKGIFK